MRERAAENAFATRFYGNFPETCVDPTPPCQSPVTWDAGAGRTGIGGGYDGEGVTLDRYQSLSSGVSRYDERDLDPTNQTVAGDGSSAQLEVTFGANSGATRKFAIQAGGPPTTGSDKCVTASGAKRTEQSSDWNGATEKAFSVGEKVFGPLTVAAGSAGEFTRYRS